MKFEWDKEKAASNRSKHGVSVEKQKQSLTILFMLTSMIQITLLGTRSDTLLLGSQVESDY